MTKYNTLEYITPQEILEVMLFPQEQVIMLETVKQFYRHSYDVGTSIYNGALIFGIIKSKENNRLPNIVYLRKVMETFENMQIKTTAAIIKFLEDYKSYQNKQIKRAIAEPEYMDDFEAKIAAMEL